MPKRFSFPSCVLAAGCLILLFGCAGGDSSNGAEQSSSDSSAFERSFFPTHGTDEYSTNEFEQNNNELEQNEEDFAPAIVEGQSARCSSYVEGIPLGIACLHCGERRAQSQAITIAETMANSCRRNIATTMLIDGTFSDDRDFLGEIVRILTEKGSRLHLYLYLSNGPWQRRYERMPNKGVGTKISPEDFRNRIHSDPALQASYTDRINWALPLISYSISRGAAVYLIPMLEDNLDQAAFLKMVELTIQAVPSSLPIAIGRNSCVGCYPGNDGSVPTGLFEDQHLHSEYQHVYVLGGLVTNDGAQVSFPHEADTGDLNLDKLYSAISRSARNNSSFVIWRKNYQGLFEGGVSVDPSVRNYEMPSPADQQVLLELLQTTF